MPFQRLMPLARSVRMWLRYARAECRLNGRDPLIPECLPPVYIVGCGRSGTTVLARIFADHPEVALLMEPYHLWTLVEARTDISNLFCHTAAGWVLHGDDVTAATRQRFERLILSVAARAGKRRTMEKTPHNVARIGFLERLAAGSQYVHIVRNGLDVVHSIERLATENSYRLWHRPHQNQWWGNEDAKWAALVRFSRESDLLADVAPRLKTDVERGAFEWVASLHCADYWRGQLEERLHELTYRELTNHPREVLQALCSFAELSCPEDWLERSAQRLSPRPPRSYEPVVLPGELCDAFNAMQQRYGFEGRAFRGGERARGNGRRAV